MKTLYESILDDEDVLVRNIYKDINNPVTYFINNYTIKKINDKYDLQDQLDKDKKFLNLVREFFKFDDGLYWEVGGVKSQDYIKNPLTRTVKLMDKDGNNIMNITHMSEFNELHLCLKKPDIIKNISKNLHKNYIKNFSKIKNDIKKIFKIEYSTFKTSEWGFFVIQDNVIL